MTLPICNFIQFYFCPYFDWVQRKVCWKVHLHPPSNKNNNTNKWRVRIYFNVLCIVFLLVQYRNPCLNYAKVISNFFFTFVFFSLKLQTIELIETEKARCFAAIKIAAVNSEWAHVTRYTPKRWVIPNSLYIRDIRI